MLRSLRTVEHRGHLQVVGDWCWGSRRLQLLLQVEKDKYDVTETWSNIIVYYRNNKILTIQPMGGHYMFLSCLDVTLLNWLYLYFYILQFMNWNFNDVNIVSLKRYIYTLPMQNIVQIWSCWLPTMWNHDLAKYWPCWLARTEPLFSTGSVERWVVGCTGPGAGGTYHLLPSEWTAQILRNNQKYFTKAAQLTLIHEQVTYAGERYHSKYMPHTNIYIYL